ncbi:hypothetical protein BOTBODRAFT_188332 [Botryobasidium botryosum FD-172 SS1]|uniref:Uncharacterized protein n=1 Tax=Botryobasidium botryosum (strain FD-172 SS1) TaxID=930990 RepID=A0A067MED9_BOTB1|nr:hypothetical protein BOTBODRAFT_188332 [Botryobasidium botryosum FD-172 SS1]
MDEASTSPQTQLVEPPAQITKKELEIIERSWRSNLEYHKNNLLLLIQELDGFGFGYTSLLVNNATSDGTIEKPSSCSRRRRTLSLHEEFNTRPSALRSIDYETRFMLSFVPIATYVSHIHPLLSRCSTPTSYKANYACILIKQISYTSHRFAAIMKALLYDLNQIGPPPPHVPARPRFDDVERAFDTRVFFEAPRIAAIMEASIPPQVLKGIIERFGQLNPYFPPFLLGFKHGDSIPHFRDVQTSMTKS